MQAQQKMTKNEEGKIKKISRLCNFNVLSTVRVSYVCENINYDRNIVSIAFVGKRRSSQNSLTVFQLDWQAPCLENTVTNVLYTMRKVADGNLVQNPSNGWIVLDDSLPRVPVQTEHNGAIGFTYHVI